MASLYQLVNPVTVPVPLAGATIPLVIPAGTTLALELLSDGGEGGGGDPPPDGGPESP